MPPSLADLVVTLEADARNFRSSVSEVKALSEEMRKQLDLVGKGSRAARESQDGLIGSVRKFASEQRSQARVARFYAAELLSIVPAGDAVKGTLQDVLGVMIEGAAGGLSFGLALEAAKFGIGLVVQAVRAHEEELKRAQAAENVLLAVQLGGRERVRAATTTLTEGQKAYRAEIETQSKVIDELVQQQLKLREQGPGVFDYIKAAIAPNFFPLAESSAFREQDRNNKLIAKSISEARNYAEQQAALATEAQRKAQSLAGTKVVIADTEKRQAAAAEHLLASYRAQAEALSLQKDDYFELKKNALEMQSAIAAANLAISHAAPGEAVFIKQRLADELRILEVKKQQAERNLAILRAQRELQPRQFDVSDAKTYSGTLQGTPAQVAGQRARADYQWGKALEGTDLFSVTEASRKKQLDDIKEMYQQIDAWRGNDVQREADAQRMKAALDSRAMDLRLSREREFFSTLAALQYSSVRELAAIGKAAAITQATIDGILAVQKALATFPPPFSFAMAAAVGAVTAANVAQIAARASGGPVSGGRDYLVGERGPELFRPGVSGTIIPNHAIGAVATGPQLTIINQAPGVEVVPQRMSDGEIVALVRRTVAADMHDPNSRVRKAMSQSTTAGARR